ncbi:MAG: response regulator [Leptolyngbyaceae cyanobacterium MO_188.B28]|nr:response regulator [Leptolyngbyaceae cyanobacterium MO_188.B28]
MTDSFNGIQVCREIAQSDKNGCFQVESNGVTWKVYVANGRLQYAYNSLHSIETLIYHLTQLGHELSFSGRETLHANFQVASSNPQLAPWGPLYFSLERLYRQQGLEANTFATVNIALSKDALETLLWLQQANHFWSEGASDLVAGLPSLSDILDRLEMRLQAWRRLCPVITSPDQQPYCPDLTKLDQPVSQGRLSRSLLTMLVKLMQGNSIRQLSLFLKQDSLKVAQLLHPYIQQQILRLHPPASPLDKLPPIPPVQASQPPILAIPQLQDRQQPVLSQEPSPFQVRQREVKKVCKIVCIDDSPAMLETLERYLGAEGFEVATVENPMESMSTLFSMKPDLILMDVSMPGLNGNRLCQILRRSAAFKQLPIIMVSGNTSALDKAKAESSGATAYLTKPFSKEALLAIIDTHLTVAATV